jgi:hypothetical protein
MLRAILYTLFFLGIPLVAVGAGTVPTYYGSVNIPTGGTYTDGNQTASACAGWNTSKQLTSVACSLSLSATAPLVLTGSTLSINPVYVDLTSNQSIAGTKVFTTTAFDTAAPAFVQTGGNGDVFWWGTSQHVHLFVQTTSPYSVQGVIPSDFGIFDVTAGLNLFAFSGAGNMGVYNNVTAANFFNGSKAAYKQDIHPLILNGLGVLDATSFVSYRYKPKYGDPADAKIGFVADTTPTVLSGKSHDHFDAGALSVVDAVAIKQLAARVNRIESSFRALCHKTVNRSEPECAAR